LETFLKSFHGDMLVIGKALTLYTVISFTIFLATFLSASNRTMSLKHRSIIIPIQASSLVLYHGKYDLSAFEIFL
jgi:hypothetical protein